MLKRFTFRKIAITSLLLLLALLLYNYPVWINENTNESNKEYINIYLIDSNDFVSMTKILNQGGTTIIDKVKFIIDSLTIGSNNTLPMGYKPIIPRGTKLNDISLDDGLLKIDFSKSFFDVSLDDEEEMMEAIVYSLTAIKEIEKIIIFVDGVRLDELPNSHKKLNLYLDRSYGINKVYDITSFHDTSMITVYYTNYFYKDNYIPVSYITNDNSDKIEIIINSLRSNRLYSSNLSSHLDYQVELMNYEANQDEVILNFNNFLMDSVFNGRLEEEVKYAVSYSIYDTLGIENIVFMVDNNKIDEFRLEN